MHRTRPPYAVRYRLDLTSTDGGVGVNNLMLLLGKPPTPKIVCELIGNAICQNPFLMRKGEMRTMDDRTTQRVG
jgi:hypothetical protein